MTRVCFVGSPDVTLQYELLSRETSREALATYDLARPFENSIAVRTVSLGAAVSLCNDLQWYIVRFVDEVLIQEPSVSDEEWLSRNLAVALRNGDIEPEDTGEHLKLFGLERPDATPATDQAATVTGEGEEPQTDSDPTSSAESGSSEATDPSPGTATVRPKLVEPLYVRRVDGEVPEYDLRDVEDTLVVRLTESEFSP
ncbi:DUF5804 family protein [Natronosalvus vescus]|uniref:DUF5804 family protein n=1 Tax=Natronosalvus vescus TaxID=2953881 RepID=UPI002091C071|nr:DUF5804 family protein [Natronosalvus vescus]